MFNENIDELRDIIPSVAIMRLYAMLKDVYKNGNKPYLLNEVDMQKLYINYSDKYTPIDKVILLTYGITSISNYKIDEETISIERVNIKSLSEKEKGLYDKKELKELVTPKVVLDSNVGTVVIGYDYAYVRKETYTPNVEITDEQKVILDDERLVFDMNYPYIHINPDDQILTIRPLIDYDIFTMKTPAKYTYEKYVIDIQKYDFKRFHTKQPYKYTDGCEQIEQQEKDIPKIEGWEYTKSYLIKKDPKEKLIIEYTKDDKTFQFITNNDYSVATISFDDTLNEYIISKTYFVNYGNE